MFVNLKLDDCLDIIADEKTSDYKEMDNLQAEQLQTEAIYDSPLKDCVRLAVFKANTEKKSYSKELETIKKKCIIRKMLTNKSEDRDQSIQKLSCLLTDQHCRNLHSRHQRALEKVQKLNTDGFLLRTISQVCELLKQLTEDVACNPNFRDYIIHLVDLCSWPPWMETVYDKQTYFCDYVTLLNLV
ncbi:uncharacterized protein LOC111089669, partial [Limulus polyphemus]|uniref:Uncharacterized protein LOC111089669 n=1 Tax=Limulus polyphemus TaxID=6850 RepID=A0ABM1TQY0_LIMPO